MGPSKGGTLGTKSPTMVSCDLTPNTGVSAGARMMLWHGAHKHHRHAHVKCHDAVCSHWTLSCIELGHATRHMQLLSKGSEWTHIFAHWTCPHQRSRFRRAQELQHVTLSDQHAAAGRHGPPAQ